MHSIYYSAARNGFFDSALFGTRTVRIPDPNWVRPQIEITVAPGETAQVGHELVHNDTEAPITLQAPDETAEHPHIEVENPDCQLPDDALPISRERHQELLAGVSGTTKIGPDPDGMPALIQLPPPSPEQLAAIAISQRNQLLQIAAQFIAPLQDAVDLGEATDNEMSALTSWKRYRVQLNRIELQADYPARIEWPVRPDEIVA